MSVEALRDKVKTLMPQARSDLAEMVSRLADAVKSVAKEVEPELSSSASAGGTR